MAEPVNDEGKATARAQQEAYLAGLRRERDGYAERGDRPDRAHDMTFAERVKEVDAEIERTIKELETSEVALSTIGRPEGPSPDEHHPNIAVTQTEPTRTPTKVRPAAAPAEPKKKAAVKA